MNQKISIIIVILLVAIAGLYWASKQIPQTGENVTNTNTTQTTNTTNTSSTTTGAPVASFKGADGEYLVDKDGMTLYVFADDTSGKSNCSGECAVTWPPFAYDNQDWRSFGDLSARLNVVKRDSGEYQYAYGTKALYHYKGDKKPGDMNGQGVNNKWSIVPVTK